MFLKGEKQPEVGVGEEDRIFRVVERERERWSWGGDQRRAKKEA